ncbi:TPR repeat-containing thioredoxin TTL1 [Morella rubra]|uniref:TPR repeat-containing thioredoxin TTL1 n=1 Tax=Morella rubra TaxID=262757 RepID=A0A6A1VU61_9ROSI|nr:TPR repeat-containing thioredoxin TTL1 [Morella rubra]
MSHSGKPTSEQRLDALSDRFRDSLSCEANKPDFRELDLGSPVSPPPEPTIWTHEQWPHCHHYYHNHKQ